MKRNRKWKWWLATSAMVLGACADTPGEPDPGTPDPTVTDPKKPQEMPKLGQTDFVSADGQNGEASRDNGNATNNAGASAEDSADADSNERSVEEGDIYRVLGDTDHILNLNAYRGLQIIDFSDVGSPEIIGHLQVSGTPVEMYSVGDRVYILMNNWQGYWGSREDVDVESFTGGLVLAVDVSDPTKPEVTGRATIPGYIRSSRLTRGDGEEALFVVTNDWSTSTTYVQSYSVSEGGRLAAKSRIDLDTDGYLTDIQASSELLMVARFNWNQQEGSEVSLIDISSPDGTMIEGDTVRVKGYVQKKTNMDHRDDVLRVVSGNTWSSTANTNHVETFDVSDIQNITPIDAETFGDGENLFATVFVDEKAFFVTYRQVDPFHAFSIDSTGEIEEKSEFIVSGWNDFFKPVSADTRLIGIGKNDQNGVTLAVSLYDIEDLTNPSPMIDREELDLSWSWSEANWDDRAFTVLEKGTSVTAPTGEVETGLVLLPFSGWDDSNDRYVSGVQIFTFSDETLTKRGVMMQDTQVRRSFVADSSNNTTGNLSEAELSLFDTTDPDQPQELSRLELAPNYTGFLTYGDHGVRRRSNHHYWGWWGRNASTTPTDTVQIVDLDQNVDEAKPVAEVEVPSNARLFKVDDLLVSVAAEYLGYDSNTNKANYETTIDVWDLADPTQPVAKGSLTTRDLPSHYYYDYYYGPDVAVDGLSYYYYGNVSDVQVLDEALVFVEREQQLELEGVETVRSVRPRDSRYQQCYDESTWEPRACTYLSGGITCRQLTRVDGTVEAEVCQGSFYRCTQDATGNTDCNEVDPADDEIEEHTWSRDRNRHWTSMTFHPLDLTDPATPTLVPAMDGGTDNEAVRTLAKDDKLYFSYRRPYTVPGDSRPFVKYYFKEYDFSNPGAPTSRPAVNVPGELLEIDGDVVLTRDFLWGQNIIESSVNKLKLQGNLAYLQGAHRFTDREVHGVQLDGAGHVLVSHQESWRSISDTWGGYDAWDRTVTLAILDLAKPNLDQLSEVQVDDWARLTAAVSGRALFTVPGGILVLNTSDADNAHAQAYFPMRGWPSSVEVGDDEVYFAAGPYGVYTFDIDEYNLLTNL